MCMCVCMCEPKAFQDQRGLNWLHHAYNMVLNRTEYGIVGSNPRLFFPPFEEPLPNQLAVNLIIKKVTFSSTKTSFVY